MSTKKSLGETVLGWFVVRDGEDDEKHGAPAPAAAKAVPRSAPTLASPLPAPPVERQPAAHAPAASVAVEGELPPVVAGAAPDAKVFAQVYRAAEISEAEQERVEKALTLVQSLPTETPREIKKQIVEASLSAFGIPVDQIIEAGVQEIQALDAYIKHGERRTQEALADAGARVARLEAEIAEVRRLMELQVSAQATLTRASNGEKLRVQAVLEFFGQEAVARVVQASPKLVE